MERYKMKLEEVKEKGYTKFVDKESGKLVEIEYCSIPESLFKHTELTWSYYVYINKEIVYQDSNLDIETLRKVIEESSVSQEFMFSLIAQWLEKFGSEYTVYVGESEIQLSGLMKHYSKKLNLVDIHRLSHLIDGLKQSYELHKPEYFASKVVKILKELGVVDNLIRLEKIKYDTIDSVLNRALLGDNTKGI